MKKKKPDNEQSYWYALEKERKREQSHAQTSQGRFEQGFLSLDNETPDGDPARQQDGFASDQGQGAAIIRESREQESLLDEKIRQARRRLYRYDKRLITVFNLLIKYKGNHEGAIWELMKKRERKAARKTLARRKNGL